MGWEVRPSALAGRLGALTAPDATPPWRAVPCVRRVWRRRGGRGAWPRRGERRRRAPAAGAPAAGPPAEARRQRIARRRQPCRARAAGDWPARGARGGGHRRQAAHVSLLSCSFPFFFYLCRGERERGGVAVAPTSQLQRPQLRHQRGAQRKATVDGGAAGPLPRWPPSRPFPPPPASSNIDHDGDGDGGAAAAPDSTSPPPRAAHLWRGRPAPSPPPPSALPHGFSSRAAVSGSQVSPAPPRARSPTGAHWGGRPGSPQPPRATHRGGGGGAYQQHHNADLGVC